MLSSRRDWQIFFRIILTGQLVSASLCPSLSPLSLITILGNENFQPIFVPPNCKKIIIIIFTYEVYIEKSIIEILSRKFISVTLNIYELKISNLMINIYLTILIYLIYLLIYLINF